ncbi:MAG: hypothetical protein ACE3L7_19420 [Candidatus Pristimantibacillus sp.]
MKCHKQAPFRACLPMASPRSMKQARYGACFIFCWQAANEMPQTSSIQSLFADGIAPID